jgi:DNA-binding transcriptional regulator YhcF (GntR family)
MRFWFARDSDVPIREQLVTQVVLGILCHDLAPGERLPSTRELARRFSIHANTISAGYRELEKQNWVEFRHGSGVFVRATTPQAAASPDLALDELIANLFRSARALEIPLATVRSRLRSFLALQPPDHFLVIESDEELRRIVVEELRQSVSLRVEGADLSECRHHEKLLAAIPLALPSKAEQVRKRLPPGTDLITLQIGSIPSSLAQWLPAKTDVLVAIASRWPRFLTSARTMLIAAGLQSDALIVRDARKRGWQSGLAQTQAVLCDVVTAPLLPAGPRKIVFNLLDPASIAEIRRFESSLNDPSPQVRSAAL